MVMCTKKLFLSIVLSVILISLIPFVFAAEAQFQAVYNCIFDTDVGKIFIDKAVMSKDGNIVICFGRDSSNTAALYRMNSNGSDFYQFTLPEYVVETFGDIRDITVNNNGTIAYFYCGLRIFKVFNNEITEIFNSEDSENIHQFLNLQTTSSGDFVFFQLTEDYRCGSLWQIDQNGQNLIKIIDPVNVINNNESGAGFSIYAISDDADEIAFILKGFWNDDGNYINNGGLFIWTPSSQFKQLTQNSDSLNSHGIHTGFLDISGNGNCILFCKNNSDGIKCYYTINSDGTNLTELAPIDIPGYKDMDYDGTIMLLNDSRTQGRLVSTDGLWKFDITPYRFGTWRTDINLSYNRKVCFVGNNPGHKGVYVGILDTQHVNLDNPIIEKVTFDPETFPKNNPDNEVKIKAKIYNPDGIEEIDKVEMNILYKGCNKLHGYSDCQVWIPFQPNNDGYIWDEIAGDSIYTAVCRASTLFDSSDTYNDQAYVRVVVRNNKKAYALYDAILKIKTETEISHEHQSNPVEFSLSQNYPNPFNPITVISYQLPVISEVELNIYNILGQKVATLVSIKQQAGKYKVEFDASGLVSGIYYYRLKTNQGFMKTRKLILLK